MKKAIGFLVLLAALTVLTGTALADSDIVYYTVNSNKTSVTITGYDGGTNLVIPDKLDGLTVTAIGDGAFKNNKTISSVTIPSTVLSVGSEAFYGCTGMSSISIPNSVTNIGSSAFRGCVRLSSVTLPNRLTFIASYLFYGCSGLHSISIPNSVTIIYEFAFYGTSLQYIAIPASVTTIGSRAFGGIGGATISIPASTTSIYGYDSRGVISSYANEDAFGNIKSNYFIVADESRGKSYVETRSLCHTIQGTGYVKHYGTIQTKTANGVNLQYCDRCGKNISKARLTAQPENVEGTVGNAVTLSVSAAGDGLTYQWYIQRAADAEFTKTDGVEASYTFTLTSQDNRAQLYCVIQDCYGTTIKTDTVTVKAINPAPTVEPTPTPIPASLTASASNMQADGTFTVAVGIEHNPGFAFISVDSDAASKGITIEDAQGAGEALDWSVTAVSKIVLYANENMTQDGTFLVLTMKSDSGEETELTFTVSECYNAQERAVSVLGTTVEIKKGSIIGDVTGDGNVDGRDLLRLARYIAGDTVAIDGKAADVTGDGMVDGRDVLRLAKRLAGT